MRRTNTPSKTIQSDEKLLDIIEFLQDSDGAGVTDTADHLGIAKSTVHGHLSTLQRRGYVVNNGGNYRLGLQFFNHGIYVRRRQPIYPHVKMKVRELAQETGERAWCVVEENGLGYYLYGAKGENPVYPPVRVGNNVYLHQIAGGKAILSHLPDENVTDIVEQHGFPTNTEHTITDKERLQSEIERTRERGFAIDDEESLRQLMGYAVPIIDEKNTVHGALSVTGPKKRMEQDSVRESVINELFVAINEIEINISYKLDHYATPFKKREI